MQIWVTIADATGSSSSSTSVLASASTAVAGQQCQCGDDRHRHRHRRKVRRWYAAVPDSSRARADRHRSRTWHAGTLANWIIRAAELHYSRLYEALRRTLLSRPLIHDDETTVQVLKEPGKDAQSTSYMWVYRSAEDCAQPVVLFDYWRERSSIDAVS